MGLHDKGGCFVFSGRKMLRPAVLRVAVGFMIAAFAPFLRGAQEAETPRPALDKLVTVLAEMARVYSPQGPAAPALRGAAPQAFSLEAMPHSVRDAVRTRLMRINPQGEVQVYIMMNPVSDERLRELAASGVTVEIIDAQGSRVQARVPVSRLEEVAGLPFVNLIRLPSYAHRMTGSVNTEGDEILRSDLARAQLGLSGAGVKVGVISDGIKGVFANVCTTCGGVAGGPISTGDLPASTGTRNASGVLTSSTGGISGRSFSSDSDLEGIIPGCSFAGAGAEGTALLEIVHDLAPSAQLSFANADTDLAMNQAVNFLAASNDVVVDDFGFFGLPSDGTSTVSVNTANALNSNTNRIRGYFTSVGNGAFSHYIGTYANSGVPGNAISGITSSGNLHLFQSGSDTTDVLGLGPKPYNLILLPAGGQVYVFLTWNDPDGASTNNYDLYLVRDSTNQVVSSSTDVQAVTRSPVEIIAYTNNTGAEDYFRIVVQNVNNAAQARNLNIFAFTPECASAGLRLLAPPNHARLNFVTPTRSLSAQSDAGGSPVSVVSVGAICSASQITQNLFAGSAAPFESCYDTTNSTLEFFSAQGPTLDGRLKPDITSIDGVSVTGSGSFENPFFGTSAAAPHVAGMAALVLESAPCLIAGKTGALDNVTARTNLHNLILDNAVPLGGDVPNNLFGYGRSDALASIEQTLPTLGGPAFLTFSGNTPSGVSLMPAQLGFSDPNSCPLTTLSWSGGCGTGPGATMPCPFGTSNVSVGASSNGVAFSAPVSVQITVTNFSVGGSPASQTVAAGNPATYTVTVTAVSGAYSNSVTLGCSNLPAETTCAFNPPAVTPGAGSVTSTLTISTTPRPPVSASFEIFPPSLPVPASRLVVSAGFMLAALAVMFRAVRRRTDRRTLSAGAALSLALAMLGIQLACGGGAAPPPTPSAKLSATSVNFGPQPFGSTSPSQPVSLSNSGTSTLAISSISTSGDFAQTNNCGTALGAGSNCTINVTFSPTSAGTRSGTLGVMDNASGSPHTASLSGTGLAGTATGSYPITVTGTAGTLVNSGVVTLDVQ
ncbi:MAG: choice-of-anchor D domain-containing protein [Acidobacteria bacterium]|nr:choice-of-anchor D domain-containing protein [Acidobacteriota bacterium]